MLRRTGLRRKIAMVGRRSDTGPDRNTVEAVYERAGWLCELCGDPVEPVRGVGHHLHHRRPRASGGSKRPDTNSTANLLLLCPPCHGYVESERAQALECGWLLPQTAVPAGRAVLLHCGSRWRYLTDVGTYAVDPPEVTR